MKQIAVIAFFVSSLCAFASTPDTLDIGSPAPLLKPSKWVKGTPVKGFATGKIYVIEFWATWCTPCKEAMPHLSELARKHKGQVEFVGVDAFEQKDEAKVVDFVNKQGKRMDYTVALDLSGDRTASDWMTAAGETGIPVTFIVGKDGQIAWIGRPTELDSILPKVIEGTFDIASARRQRTANRNPESAVLIAAGAGNYAKVVELVDAQIAKNPKIGDFCPIQLYSALAHLDVSKLRKHVAADLKRTNNDFGTYNGLTLALSMPGLPREAYVFGVEIVGQALAITDQRQLLGARGAEMAQFAGDWTKAVELQSIALKAAESNPNCSPERLAELRKDLEKFRAKRKEGPF